MRVLALLFCLAVSALFHSAALSASLSERSPVRLGLWWDPAHSGSGFEVFRGGGQIALIWYTYRENGAPVWYTAVSTFDGEGHWDAPLMKYRWSNGALAAGAEVGRLRLERTHFEHMTLRWTLDGKQGEQSLEPFPLSGIVPEVDHSGAWYDPRKSGFGVSLIEQGERMGAALYFYDTAGEPIWRIGENGGRGTEFKLYGYTGGCPGCTGRATERSDEGLLSLRFESETALTATYRGAGTAPWPLDGRLVQLSTPASQRVADRQLAAFDDAPGLRRYLDGALLDSRLNQAPIIDFSPAPATTTYSTTNVQESGVDEADRLKTDGSLLYTFAKGLDGRDQPLLRIAEAREDGRQLVLHSPVPLPSTDASEINTQSGLYLSGNRLVTLQGPSPSGYAFQPLWDDPRLWTDGSTRVAVFDRSAPAAPRLLQALQFDGFLVASRRIGSRLYLVIRKSVTWPAGFEYWYGATTDPAVEARNRERVAGLAYADMIPRVRVGSGAWQPLLEAKDVYLPVAGTATVTPEFVSVVMLDLNAPENLRAMAVAGPVAAVYASPERMYLATTRSGVSFDPASGYVVDGFAVTDVHEIALGDRPVPLATGSIEGRLDRDSDRAPLRFSEQGGKLRVVTVDGPWWGTGKNRLTVLEPSSVAPGLLRTLSYLPNPDRPAPLGKPNETLYGTRFVGDRLYAVTFLRTDPLYVVDLSNPAAPFIAGEVQLPGFSDYLHPVGDKLLLGVGLDARGEGQFAWFQGLLFSLFDVSDPSRPRVLQQTTLGKRGSGSALLRHHHALSALPGTEATRFALPVRVHEPDGKDPPAPPDDYYYHWSWSGLQSFAVSGNDPATARIVQGRALVTHRRSEGLPNLGYDDAVSGARSVLFARGIVYCENGRFWRMDPDGTHVSGPF